MDVFRDDASNITNARAMDYCNQRDGLGHFSEFRNSRMGAA